MPKTKKVDARNLTIEATLKKGQFIIPQNQREYSWEITDNEDGEINELWEDLVDFTEESHFLGHIVLEGGFDDGTYEVIDGQQRLTTITLLLIALRDEFIKRGNVDLARAAEGFIFTQDRKNKGFFVLNNQMPYPVLQTYQDMSEKRAGGLPSQKIITKLGEKNIISAYEFFIHKLGLENDIFIENLYNKILDSDIIFVASEGIDGASIFETLNATGKDLTSVDLIKNAVFKEGLKKKTAVNHTQDNWNSLVDNCGDKLENFFIVYWAAIYGRVSKYENKLYKAFKKNVIRGKVSVSDFLNSLNAFSKVYKMIITPNRGDWGKGDEVIFQYLYFITSFGSIANPVLLVIIDGYINKIISKDYCQKALGSIANFHFLHNKICSKRSSGWDKKYSSHATDLFNAKTKALKHIEIDKLILALKDKHPTDAEIKLQFDKKISYEKDTRLVRYILFREELALTDSSLSLITDDSIEHLYPKANGLDIKKWPSNINNSIMINSIGNLFLLEKKINSDHKYGCESFSEKKKIIQSNSVFLSTKQYLSKVSDWTEKEIVERKEFIISFLQLI